MLQPKSKCEFEFYRDQNGSYHYRCNDKKEMLFTSTAFASFDECNERLKLLVATPSDEIRQKFRVTKTKQCVFVLRAKNLTLGISIPFNEVMECRVALNQVMKALIIYR